MQMCGDALHRRLLVALVTKEFADLVRHRDEFAVHDGPVMRENAQ